MNLLHFRHIPRLELIVGRLCETARLERRLTQTPYTHASRQQVFAPMEAMAAN
jgi:hypothetical protein